MRGHVADMAGVVALCEAHGVILIEDCAHTLGASYDGTPTGLFGAAGCFSLQTWKQINAGEGGIIVTDDEDLAARAILASGAYMLHAQHGTPPSEDVIQRWAPHTPNCSMRLNELAAAIALPQLASLEERNDAWRAIYNRLEAGVRGLPNLRVPHTLDAVVHAPTSFQFIADLPAEAIEHRVWPSAPNAAYRSSGSAGLKRQDSPACTGTGVTSKRVRCQRATRCWPVFATSAFQAI